MTTLTSGIRVIKDILVEYIDIDYSLWLTWMLTPLLLSFLLPLVIILLFYTTAMILYIYKHREKLRGLSELDFWNRARKTVALLWDAHGWVWYGYEIEGLENLPDGGALIVYYHGTLPVDLYYFIARVYLLKNRLVQTVADRFLFNIPGWNIISEGIKVIPGTVSTCCQIVESGNLLAVSPGGVYEALFGDQSYPIMWKSRVGFAKVALQAKVISQISQFEDKYPGLPSGRDRRGKIASAWVSRGKNQLQEKMQPKSIVFSFKNKAASCYYNAIVRKVFMQP